MNTPSKINEKEESNLALCPVAKKCGGCQLQNMSYERQLKWKQARCEILLKKFGKVEKIIGMENPYHYRNKVQSAFARVKGRVISGVYQSATRRVVGVDGCMTEDIIADKIILTIRKLAQKFKVLIYDERTNTGFLRHVLVRRGFKTGEVMVVIVGANNNFTSKKAFVKELLAIHPEITTVIFNINSSQIFLNLGDKEEILHGKGYIEDILCGCRFRISSRSFYQINPVQTEKLYDLAVSLADIKKDSRILDAYCGIGTIGLIASQKGGSVVGVELNSDAVKDAVANAKLNGTENIEFCCGDASDFIETLAKNGEKLDIVFMDPPRAGSTKKFVDALGELMPERIVYISCNPETLARDLYFIKKKGYKVKKICPVDMFPHTNHCETIALLCKQ